MCLSKLCACESKLCVCVSKLCVNKLCESMHSKARMTCDHFIHNYCAFILYTISYLRCVTVAVTKCHACHANSCGARQTQARHQSQPSAISAAPATQSEGRRHQVPRLPCKVKVHVANPAIRLIMLAARVRDVNMSVPACCRRVCGQVVCV